MKWSSSGGEAEVFGTYIFNGNSFDPENQFEGWCIIPGSYPNDQSVRDDYDLLPISPRAGGVQGGHNSSLPSRSTGTPVAHASGQGGSWAVTAAQTSLSFMTADVMVLDPSDAAAVYKLIGYGVVATAAWAVLYFNGTSNYPGPWSTDRPKNYIPAPLNGPNNRNYFPQGNGNDFIKWTIRLGGASVLGKKLYDGFNLQPNFMPSDNTNFVNPTPPPMPPFYTPKPNPNRP
jgi:hypothetical protein